VGIRCADHVTPLPAKDGTTSPTAAVVRSVYFACGLRPRSLFCFVCRALLEKLIVSQVVKTFLALCGAQRFTTAFIRARMSPLVTVCNVLGFTVRGRRPPAEMRSFAGCPRLLVYTPICVYIHTIRSIYPSERNNESTCKQKVVRFRKETSEK
jgi:hypothetical protein